MKNFTYLKMSRYTVSIKLAVGFILLSCFLLFNSFNTNSHRALRYSFNRKADSIAEKKVDYIECIYFSGKKRDDLKIMILKTIQEMEAKPATEAVARQYVFLSSIKNQANAEGDVCEIEEMLAVGIYDIDANEAVQQNIPKPGEKFSAKFDSALAAVNSLGNSAVNVAGTGFILSGGTYKSYKTFVGVARKVAVIDNVTTTISGVKDTYNKVNDLKNKYFGNHPCKSVPQKNIEIGDHIVQAASAAVDK